MGLLAAVLAALALTPALASAAKVREPEGVFGAVAQPSFAKAMAMAVDHSSGDLLVVDQEAKTLSRYKPNGEAAPFAALGTNAIDGKGSGSGPGSGGSCVPVSLECDETPQNGLGGFGGSAREIEVAVDNSCALHELTGAACESEYPADGDIYVTQSPSHLIDVFSREGEYLGQLTKFGATALGEACGVAVDGSGALYVGDYSNSEIHKYEFSGVAPTNADNTANFAQETTGVAHPCQLAAGTGATAGSLFAVQYVGPTSRLNAVSGAAEGVLNEGMNTTTVGVDPTTGYPLLAIYSVTSSSPQRPQVREYDGSGALIYEPIEFGNFEHEMRGLTLGPDGTLYLTRLDSSNVQLYSPLQEIPPRIEAEWVSDVSSGEATLEARFGLLEQSTSYHVEYLTEAEYNANGGSFSGPNIPHRAPLGGAPVGSARTISVALTGLVEGSTYHWRFVATDPAGTTEGEDRTFRTFHIPAPNTACPNQALRGGAAAGLPDCRGYEMVSPVDKNGGDVDAYFYEGFDASLKFAGLDQATPDGAKLAYTAATAFADAQASPLVSEYIASRGSDGWTTESIDPPMEGGAVNEAFNSSSQFKAFTSDLCRGFLVSESATQPLALEPREPVYGFRNAYRRENCAAPGSFSWLESSAEEPEPCATSSCETRPTLWPDVQGFSTSGDCAVFRVNDALTPEAPTGLDSGAKSGQTVTQLYLRCEGQELRLASRLPGGAPFEGNSSAGSENGVAPFTIGSGGEGHVDTVENAFSEDGTRVYWTASSASPGASEASADAAGKLYLRVNAGLGEESAVVGNKCVEPAKACTVQVSPSGLEGLNKARFWTANRDATRAIFSIFAGPDAGKLYDYEFNPAEGKGGVPKVIAGKTLGVAGASRGATRLYFASEEVCSSEPNSAGDLPQEGGSNLYSWESGESCEAKDLEFVAALADEDEFSFNPSFWSPSPLASVPREHIARATPDGMHLAFVSAASLTGYDNTDAASGEVDREVYLYDAATKKLLCASCNPSGARPHGADLDDDTTTLSSGPLWTAAYISGYQHQLYGRRMLSADGDRLFFNSVDPLDLRDVNGAQDVYQWEAPGTGDCTSESSTYSEQNGGCVSLISSGQSPQDSEFVDASTDGSDVFFRTAKSLVARDPGSIDIYDARVRGGEAAPEEAIPCEGDSCQSVPPAPGLKTPGSAHLQGPGNQVPLADCRPAARRAAALSRHARRLRRASRRLARGGEARKARRLAHRLARRARSQSKRARRCRRANRRAGR